jgi:hypothetical protein
MFQGGMGEGVEGVSCTLFTAQMTLSRVWAKTYNMSDVTMFAVYKSTEAAPSYTVNTHIQRRRFLPSALYTVSQKNSCLAHCIIAPAKIHRFKWCIYFY